MPSETPNLDARGRGAADEAEEERQEALSPQEAKSARTRRAICEAATRSLVEFGYRETSVLRVQSMAGVSRGALTHQYPTKIDMMGAVAEHLMDAVRRTRAPRTQARPEPGDPDFVAWHFRSAWGRLFHTAEGRALSEIFAAMRTDEALQERIAPMIADWDERIDRWFLSRLSSPEGDGAVRELVRLFRAVARGLSSEGAADRARLEAEHERLIERLATLIASQLQPRSAAADDTPPKHE
ncbi:MAG: TetR/AcrR family transcriptional regulator [Pseudomonadota bacterium]